MSAIAIDVQVNGAHPTKPRAMLWLLHPQGTTVLYLEWREKWSLPSARWEMRPVDPNQPPLTPTLLCVEVTTHSEAIAVMLPTALRWEKEPIRQADRMLKWLHESLVATKVIAE